MRTPAITALLAAALAACACGSSATRTSDLGIAPAAVLCEPQACGPALGMPSWQCPDGSAAGPTGRCILRESGCGWEVRQCPGVTCGTIAGLACGDGLVCVDAPGGCRYPTDPDCGGVCVVPRFCGGIAGIPCPAGQACVDDPRDDCAPPTGADCGGLCVPVTGPVAAP
jgi:hypothetical protein